MLDLFDAHLLAELAIEEGKRSRIYDDATGLDVVRGTTIRGNITVGDGINLMIPFDSEELDFLESHRVERLRRALSGYLWYSAQDQVRQVALADLAYNLGLSKLVLAWPHFLHYMAEKDYTNAVKEIRSNLTWIAQVHQARASRIARQIETGEWAPDVKVDPPIQAPQAIPAPPMEPPV